MDDWMVVDCGNLVVNVFDAEAREVFDLEKMYTDMRPGEDPNEGECGRVCAPRALLYRRCADAAAIGRIPAIMTLLRYVSPFSPRAGLTYEEWLQKNPIPEKWLKRLERDEEELEAAQRQNALR